MFSAVFDVSTASRASKGQTFCHEADLLYQSRQLLGLVGIEYGVAIRFRQCLAGQAADAAGDCHSSEDGRNRG